MSTGFNDHDQIAVLATPVRNLHTRLRVQHIPEGESLTQQSFQDSVDINSIIARYDRTGVLPLPTRPAQYADVSGLNKEFTDLLTVNRRVQARINEAAAARNQEATSVPDQPKGDTGGKPPEDKGPGPAGPV